MFGQLLIEHVNAQTLADTLQVCDMIANLFNGIDLFLQEFSL